MSDSDQEIDFEEGIKKINNEIIQNVLSYLKTGNFTNKNRSGFINSYTIVYKLADDEKNSSVKLFQFYVTTITNYIKNACSELHLVSDDDLIDFFLKENEKAKILIHWMRKVFVYLDKFYTKSNKTGTLFSNALKILYTNLFMPLKDRLIRAVNLLIDELRDGKAIDTLKIIGVLTVFEQVDMKDPVLNKGDDNLYWIGTNVNEVLNDWFSTFLKSTEQYLNLKSKREITCLSAPEYIKSCIRFLKEEDNRKFLFLARKYHEKLDLVNTQILVDAHSRTIARVRNF